MLRRPGPALPLLLLLAAPQPTSGGASGRTLVPVDPRRPADSARVDSVFAPFTVPGSPGCALGVIRNGTLSYARGYGLASVELGVPISPRTVFDIGSVSKQFTAMAVVLLAEEGKLSLDDEIQKFLPEIPRYAKPVTIRHLLHHTSGLRDYIDLLEWSGVEEEAVTDDRDALAVLVRQKAPNFEAGAEFLYSNTGFFLLSVIVERVSGKPLRAFAAERIFLPLGMTHTRYVDRHDFIVPGKAGSYAKDPAGGFRLALANWEQTGDGAVNTTVEDLLLWDRNFTSGKVGGQAALRELLTTGVLNDGKPITYALGLVVDQYRGARRVAHGGSWAGFRAQLSRFPDLHTSVIVLCNLAESGPGGLASKVADIVLGDRLAAPGPPASPPGEPVRGALSASPADLAGAYRSDELLAEWRIVVRGDSVLARAGLGHEAPLRPVARDSFALAGGRVTFTREADRVTGLRISSRGVRSLFLTRAAGTP
jgi:CubicO group peptidase (beta-lactamase class C family)